ncbi:TolC family protein [Martelella soudanensis]|uniref:TolC family protein n=1 Tax=unclassified Martelella TaxID=2629616 RepID=UPI0015E02272|nr:MULTISPECIES: TolC family protein [unclassified Martelella]
MKRHLMPALGSGMLLALMLALSGCVADTLALAPQSPDKQWQPADGEAGEMRRQAEASGALALTAPAVDESKVYSLPQLIDLAQRTNPDTRVAWEQARQAALAVGMADATYLPVITANVIGGSNDNAAELPIPIGGSAYFNSNINGVVPFMALQWLAFDFGGRSAVVEGAKQLSLAANYQFNATHQRLTFEVTSAFHDYNAARAHSRAASQALANSRTVYDAIKARRERGLATSVDLAQAEQIVAQEELRVVQARGGEQDTYQALLGAIGVSPMTKLKIVDTKDRRLPAAANMPTQTMIEIALANRPDIFAGYAALEASRQGVRKAKSDFMPKIGVFGTLSTYQTELDAAGLPAVENNGLNGNIMFGATIPLYDAGMRDANLKQAQSRVEAAERSFDQLKDAAAREIVVASNALTTAIQANDSAVKLRQAAYKTYDSALESYQSGVGTVSALATAQNGLLDAQLAEGDAREAAFTAAANLAFVLGTSTAATTPR